MKRNEPLDFSQPTRQSYTAIVLIMYKLYRSIVKQFGFVLLFFFIGDTSKKIGSLTFALVVVTVLVSIYSIIAFFKYYFYIEDKKLIVNSGVFKKVKLEIPFDRIQSINYEQNIIHRLFKVVKLDMDTAGSGRDEVQLQALDKDIAEELRSQILSQREEIEASDTERTIQQPAQKRELVFKLNFLQLLKVGFTANHIRSGGIIIFFFLYAYDSLEEYGSKILERLEEYIPMAEVLLESVFFVFFLVSFFFAASLIISLLRTVAKHFDLKMFRIGDGFIIESGLFNRKQFAAKDSKLQVITWSQNFLQHLSRIYIVAFKQASSVEVTVKKSLVVAGLNSENIDSTLTYIFKDKKSELDDIAWSGVNSYFLQKKLYRWTMFCVPAIAILFYLGEPLYGLYVVLFYAFGLFISYLKFKKKKFGISKNILGVKGGTFGHWTAAMEQYKIQSISVLSTPFQRRRGLASIRINTASNSLKIPDIGIIDIEAIRDYLLFRVEKTQEEWM